MIYIGIGTGLSCISNSVTYQYGYNDTFFNYDTYFNNMCDLPSGEIAVISSVPNKIYLPNYSADDNYHIVNIACKKTAIPQNNDLPVFEMQFMDIFINTSNTKTIGRRNDYIINTGSYADIVCTPSGILGIGGKDFYDNPFRGVNWIDVSYDNNTLPVLTKHKTISLHPTYIDTIDSVVQCYGTYCHSSGVIYILLKKSGIMCCVNPFTEMISYYQLAIQSGGMIKQFYNGYYIVDDMLGNLFLYHINNNGTLISQLIYNTYNSELPLEFLQVV